MNIQVKADFDVNVLVRRRVRKKLDELHKHGLANSTFSLKYKEEKKWTKSTFTVDLKLNPASLL